MRVLPPHRILKSLAAAAVCMSAEQAGLAETIQVNTVNKNIGYANVNTEVKHFTLAASMHVKSGPIKIATFGLDSAVDVSTAMFKFRVAPTAGNNYFAARFSAGKTFNFKTAANKDVSAGGQIAVGSVVGGVNPGTFTDKYYLFSFTDSVNTAVTHYGWMYGSLSAANGSHSGLTYDLISYAWDTGSSGTPLYAGQTTFTAVAPEPSTGAMGAIAALILGAAGVRKWKKERQA